MLRIDALRFAYPGQARPYCFEFEVGPGEIIAIGGVSGSGKSTLLDLIAGFLEPSSGTIVFEKQSLETLPVEARPVSILFQTDNLFEHLSAGANLRLALSLHITRHAAKAQAEEALDRVGLPGLFSRPVSELSGGQKQRVALARTLLLDRAILLLDEPFTGLDDAAADQSRQLIKSLASERGWHVVLVSHDAEDRQGFATRTLILEDGRLVGAAS